MMSHESEWLEKLLDRDEPFRPDAFEVSHREERPAAAPVGKPKIDLRQYFTDKGTKYTCAFCEYEFVLSQIKLWWRKPGNRRKKAPIPICPDCGNAGALLGWNHDFSERRKMGEQIRGQAERNRKMMQKAQEHERGGEEIAKNGNNKRSLFGH